MTIYPTNRARSGLVVPTLLLALTAAAQAEFQYTTNENTITITGHTGGDGHVTIPEQINGLPVAGIAPGAFSGNWLIRITIPATVTNIGSGGRSPFGYCRSLAEFEMDPLSPIYSSVEGVLFDKGRSTLLFYPQGKTGSYMVPYGVTKIGPNAFRYCQGLTNITLPQSLTDIGDSSFFESGLLGITIPNSVTNIGHSAFQQCYGLRNVTIPDNVTTISDQAFAVCAYLTKVIMGSSVAYIGTYAFANCYSLQTVFFRGNAPASGDYVFLHSTGGRIPVTLYYLPGAMGWEQYLSGRLPVLWDPKIELSHPVFGVGTNGFGFMISGSGNFSVIVEACTNLVRPAWFVVGAHRLTGDPWYFSDPEWTNSPSRFYRIPEP